MSIYYDTYYTTSEMKKTIQEDPLLKAVLEEAISSREMTYTAKDQFMYQIYSNRNDKLWFARKGKHSLEVINLLLNEEDHKINVALIENQENLPERIMEDFARNGTLDEKIAVAKKSKNRELLEFLSKQDNEKIKATVGANENTDDETINRLVQEKSLIVKEAILRNNPNVTIKAFDILLNDENEKIRSLAEFKVLLFLANSEVLAENGLWHEMAAIKQVKSCYHTKVWEQVRKETIRIFNLLKITVK